MLGVHFVIRYHSRTLLSRRDWFDICTRLVRDYYEINTVPDQYEIGTRLLRDWYKIHETNTIKMTIEASIECHVRNPNRNTAESLAETSTETLQNPL